MANNEIVIRIKDDGSSPISVDGNESPISASTNTNTNSKGAITKNQAVLIGSMAMAGRSIANYGLSNYGNFTGDYVTQAKINDATKFISNAALIGGAFAVGGPLGAIGASVGVGVSLALETYSRLENRKKEDIKAEQMRILTGTYTNSGGRL